MTDKPNDSDQEMSMDEILASIRRYVSTEDPASPPVVVPTADATRTPSRSEQTTFNQDAQRDYDTMQAPLTPSAFSPRNALRKDTTTPHTSPRTDAANTRTAPLNEFLNSAPSASGPVQSPTPQQDDVVRLKTSSLSSPYTTQASFAGSTIDTASLANPTTVNATMASFSRLESELKKQELTPTIEASSSSQPSPAITLEQLFLELARPMLAQWINTHLPERVDAIVREEIHKITRQFSK